MLTFTSFLCQRVLCTPFQLVTAVTHEIEDTILRWWLGSGARRGKDRTEAILRIGKTLS
jgi:hypothetical protein